MNIVHACRLTVHFEEEKKQATNYLTAKREGEGIKVLCPLLNTTRPKINYNKTKLQRKRKH